MSTLTVGMLYFNLIRKQKEPIWETLNISLSFPLTTILVLLQVLCIPLIDWEMGHQQESGKGKSAYLLPPPPPPAYRETYVLQAKWWKGERRKQHFSGCPVEPSAENTALHTQQQILLMESL